MKRLLCMVLVMIALSACAGLPGQPDATPTLEPTPAPTTDPNLPPPAVLTVNGQSQTAALGTYCWSGPETGMCVDKIGIPTPGEALVVTAPLEASLEIAEAAVPLTNLVMYAFAASDEQIVPLEVEGSEIFWTPPAASGEPESPIELAAENSQSFELSLEPGRYVVYVFAGFEGGDAIYGFLVEVK